MTPLWVLALCGLVTVSAWYLSHKARRRLRRASKYEQRLAATRAIFSAEMRLQRMMYDGLQQMLDEARRSG